MPLLTSPDILPEAMRFLVRALLAAPAQQIESAELVRLVAPPGLKEAMDSVTADDTESSAEDADDLRTGGTIIAEKSIDGLRTLGLVEQDGDKVRLAGAAAEWKTPSDASPDNMCRIVLDAVIRRGYSGPTSGTEDLIQAAVLLHTSDQPLRPFDTFESAATGKHGHSFAGWQHRALGEKRTGNWPVPNRTQWLSFRRWAPYLGLARPVGTTGLIPDASEALIGRLQNIKPGEYAVNEFIRQCASAVPILDGGELQAEHDPFYEADRAVLTGGLTVSLLQLEADGLVKLDQRSDASSRTLRLRPDGTADRVITTVTWQKTASGEFVK
jgi:hypothetical protein